MRDLASLRIAHEKKVKSGVLDLSSCYLSNLPSEVTKLTFLRDLRIDGHCISNLESLSELKELEILCIYGATNECVKGISNFKNLRSLDLSGSRLDSIEFLSDFSHLDRLILNYASVDNFSPVSRVRSLTKLYLIGNGIINLDFLSGLTHLDTLFLKNNRINDVSVLGNLARLKVLNLCGNQVTNLNGLQNLRNLKSLLLKENDIVDIAVLADKNALEILDLSFNRIERIAPLQDLTKLSVLDLERNRITDITALSPLLKRGMKLLNGEYGAGIKLEGNPLSTPPMAIFRRGTMAVRNWFKQMSEQGGGALYESKLMILGQGGSGKTTFAKLQFDHHHPVGSGLEESTLGINVLKNKKYRYVGEFDLKITAHLWDFGGQDIQKMLHQFFITEDCLYVLVSDRRTENHNMDYWFQIINLLGPGSSVIVLENPIKIRGNYESFALNKYRELFPGLKIDAIEVDFKRINGAHKSRWLALNELISEKLSALEIVNRRVPKKWQLVRDRLEGLKKSRFISKDEYYQICEKEPIGLSRENADLCLFYLKALGDLTYFDDKYLSTYIFLDHNWLTTGIYYILSDVRLKRNMGKFSLKQAYERWNKFKYSEEAKATLLRLLLKDKFDLCYELKEKDVFITPLLLPDDKPRQWEEVTLLYFRYQYTFMPHGMFSRLIVRLHEKIDGDECWKSGVRLIHEYKSWAVKAEVQYLNDPDLNQQVIDIRLSGQIHGCKELLDFIRNAIDPIHKEFRNLQYKQMAACNCNKCKNRIKEGEKPSFYPYQQLLDKVQNKRFFVDCPGNNHAPVNIGQILGNFIVVQAGEHSIDSDLLFKLKEWGMNINQIKNEANVDLSGARIGGGLCLFRS